MINICKGIIIINGSPGSHMGKLEALSFKLQRFPARQVLFAPAGAFK